MPAASEVVVTRKALQGLSGAIDNGAVVEADPLSVTFTVKLLDPAAVGVPEIVPFAASVSPAGSAPLAIVHAYGGVPPEAASV